MSTRGRVLLAAVLVAGLGAPQAGAAPRRAPATNIEHLVIVFDENVSFDHYFGTYPHATNPAGEPSFTAAPGTPTVDGLEHDNLLTANPNSANPKRIPRAQAVTCDQDHDYTEEQRAFDGGLMDKFVEFTAGGGCADKSIVMDYYDGNSVTGLWNLAQHFSMSDNFFSSSYGPSTPGALNLAAGTTHGATPAGAGIQDGSVIADPDPAGDDCGSGNVTMSGKNIGDQMTTAGMTWGWFQGGFKPSAVAGGIATCGTTHANAAGSFIRDYSAHHEPFQYWPSTRNGHHLPPTSTAMIGHSDQANHQYDLTDFDAAVKAGSLPQVSFLKAASFEDGHPGNSGPIDEQRWVARVVDELQASSDWATTAIVVTYDDSDGWYDHKFVSPTNGSASAADALTSPGHCGGPGVPTAGGYNGRCGPGPRLPLVVVSPWAKVNAVDSTYSEQASLPRFIEDNWGLPRIGDGSFDATAGSLGNLFDFTPGRVPAARAYLDPATGTVLGSAPASATAAPPGPTPPAVTTTTTTTTTSPAPTATTPTTPATPPATSPVVIPPRTPPVVTKLTVTGRRSGRRAALSLRLRGLPSTGKYTAKAVLSRSGRTLGTRSTTLRSTRLKLTFTARRKLVKGTYRLRLTLTRRGAKTVRVTATFRM